LEAGFGPVTASEIRARNNMSASPPDSRDSVPKIIRVLTEPGPKRVFRFRFLAEIDDSAIAPLYRRCSECFRDGRRIIGPLIAACGAVRFPRQASWSIDFMKDATRATHAGRRPHDNHGVVNPPVYHASTILSPTLAALRELDAKEDADATTYGVHGTPGTFAFEEAVAALEGGFRTRLASTGLIACTAPLLCYLSAGDHLLMVDTCYGPTRRFCNKMLSRMGVEITYYDPLAGGAIRELIRPNTRVVFTESPGSLTFEVQDIPAIAEEAHKRGCTVMLDNTWASPLYFKPFEHGVDVSIQAVTKYIGGHSDLVTGAVTATEAAYPAIREGWKQIGLNGSPDDVYLAMRGLRTLAVRMPQHWKNGLAVAEWLAGRPEVAEVLHPALPGDPGHAIWKRDFRGASSLFGFTLKPEFSAEERIAALVDGLELFGMGASWGGFESLIGPRNPPRSAVRWPRPGRADGQLMRIHVGLEDVDDLIADLDAGFRRMGRV
jgi:cystathionine beta-lyase